MANEHIQGTPKPGDILTCCETGKAFTVAVDSCSMNYARNRRGEYFSDAGVNACEVRELLDRSRTFTGYLSSDGRHFTGWKGNTLGTVEKTGIVRLTRRSWIHGAYIWSIRVTDVHGAKWYGRGSPGIVCTVRAMKG